MEDKIILTLEEVAAWSYNNAIKQRKEIKKLSFAVFCLSIAGVCIARDITKLRIEVRELRKANEPASE